MRKVESLESKVNTLFSRSPFQNNFFRRLPTVSKPSGNNLNNTVQTKQNQLLTYHPSQIHLFLLFTCVYGFRVKLQFCIIVMANSYSTIVIHIGNFFSLPSTISCISCVQLGSTFSLVACFCSINVFEDALVNATLDHFFCFTCSQLPCPSRVKSLDSL